MRYFHRNSFVLEFGLYIFRLSGRYHVCVSLLRMEVVARGTCTLSVEFSRAQGSQSGASVWQHTLVGAR